MNLTRSKLSANLDKIKGIAISRCGPKAGNYSSTSEAFATSVIPKPDFEKPMLARENAFPSHYVKSRGPGRPVYALVPGQKGELLADYVLFEETMKRVKVPFLCYQRMTSEERTIYVKHMKAVEAKKLWYKCPLTGQIIKTVSQLLYDGKCCGEGCRHCVYGLEACDEQKRKSLVWNGAYYL